MRRRKSLGGDEGWLLSYADLITNLLVFFVVILAAAQVSRSKMQQIAKSLSGMSSPRSLESIEDEIERTIDERDLEDLVSAELTNDGLEVSLNSGLVFDPGRAQIRPDLLPVLTDVLTVVVPYGSDYSFAVEGHSDSTPIAPGGAFDSNWELSSARALQVRDRLETAGIQRERIRIEGYADTKPLAPEKLEGLSDEEILARHRRVVVRIY
ncbi:MAG: flagellar motor protein MotB [Myxococcota bacterium]